MYGAAWRENSLTISSKWANSLLANRCLNTVVNFPSFSENSARLHFVPPTSPARITWPPVHEVNRGCLLYLCARFSGYELNHCRASRSRRASDSRGPQLPAGYCGTLAVFAALHTSKIGSTSDQAASTLSPRSNNVASPRTQSLSSVAYALRVRPLPNASR